MKVQDHYGAYVRGGGDGLTVLQDRARALGYQKASDDIDSSDPFKRVPSDLLSDSSLFQVSCGSGCPLRLDAAKITPEDRLVVDLGCGAGHDILLAAAILLSHSEHDKAEPSKAIGLDLTSEMIGAANENIRRYPHLKPKTEFIQADFSDGEAEFVNEYESKVDLVISNGVLNLCRDKQQAFNIAFRLLRPGGRMVFSDVMKLNPKDVDPEATIATSINGDVFSS